MPPRKPANLPRHPIGVVTERTGLSPHVLRAWERRYGVVKPGRGERGRRLYSDADVERLSLLRAATAAGRAVASVVRLRLEQLRAIVAEDARMSSSRAALPATHRTQAMLAVQALDAIRLEAVLRRALLSLGAPTFLETVLTPLLVEIGAQWHAGQLSIAQEHAATGTVSRLLGGLIRDLAVPDGGPRVAMATPRGERHTGGAMIAAAEASHAGWQVLWLGGDLPASQIALAAARDRADAVALSAPTGAAGLQAEVSILRRKLEPHVTVFLGGAGATRLASSEGVTVVRDLAHWRALLRLRAPQS